jgi:hypothetical protein
MATRRLVSMIRHKTGSMYRGTERDDFPRKLVADAIRLSRRISRKRPDGRPCLRGGLDAVRMTRPASAIPAHPDFLPAWQVDRANT